MKTPPFVPAGLALLAMTLPLAAQTANPGGAVPKLTGPVPGKARSKAATPIPSEQLRHMIDTTLVKISSISNPKQPPLDRTALTLAQADFTAKAMTAPVPQQPMYQAAQNVVANLVGAVEEHEKAVADYRYSKGVHGKQDRENAVISQPQRGWDAGAVARADAAKQKMENADSRKALLDKEKFMNNGMINAWTDRVGQLHDAIEQSFTVELVAEKQLAMLTPAPPPPPPAPLPAPKQLSAAQQYSPVGTWQAGNPSHRSATLKEDNTVIGGKWGSPWKMTGTWTWTDQPKGALAITWKDGLISNVIFSKDGGAMSGQASNGHEVGFTRSASPPPEASASIPAPAAVAKLAAGPPAASQPSSPVGDWKAVTHGHRPATLKEDFTVISAKSTGTWKWTDASKGALTITWSDGLKMDDVLSADGQTMSGTCSNGNDANFTRAGSHPPPVTASTASTAPPPPVPKPAPQPNAPAAAGPSSPVGAWTNPKGETWAVNDDGSFTNEHGAKGTWHWADATRHIMLLTWADGGTGSAAFSADGKTLQVTKPKGTVKLTR